MSDSNQPTAPVRVLNGTDIREAHMTIDGKDVSVTYQPSTNTASLDIGRPITSDEHYVASSKDGFNFVDGPTMDSTAATDPRSRSWLQSGAIAIGLESKPSTVPDRAPALADLVRTSMASGNSVDASEFRAIIQSFKQMDTAGAAELPKAPPSTGRTR